MSPSAGKPTEGGQEGIRRFAASPKHIGRAAVGEGHERSEVIETDYPHLAKSRCHIGTQRSPKESADRQTTEGTPKRASE